VIQALPKIELHVHLDCCLSWKAVSRLLPGTDWNSYRDCYSGPAKCKDLATLLRSIDHSLVLLQTGEGLRIAVEDLFDQFQQDHILYAEIRFAPLLHQRLGLAAVETVSIVESAVSRCSAETGISARVILCTLRHFTLEQSMETARLVDQFRGTNVVALDLAADEAGFPLTNHVPAFTFARGRAIPRTAHAGEARGAESVWETLAHLYPCRIGHGVRSIEDPALLAELKKQGIHLEICPSCNVQIDLYKTFEEHPVDRLFRAGVSVGINTDGRTLTSLSLTDEYERLHRNFGWGIAHFHQCNRDALDASFLEKGERQSIRELLEAGYLAALAEAEAV
jgi:adenosine deaminase